MTQQQAMAKKISQEMYMYMKAFVNDDWIAFYEQKQLAAEKDKHAAAIEQEAGRPTRSSLYHYRERLSVRPPQRLRKVVLRPYADTRASRQHAGSESYLHIRVRCVTESQFLPTRISSGLSARPAGRMAGNEQAQGRKSVLRVYVKIASLHA